ncbi:hypothetical protein ACHAXN_012565 [Cyclotella atomus]|jgi:hypothetical protein
MPSIKVPTLDLSTSKCIPKTDFDDAYSKHQAVHIRGFNAADETIAAADIQALFQSLEARDKDSWCIENKSNDSKEVKPSDFLDVNSKIHKGYCSFLVQHSEIAVNDLMNLLPVVDLPITGGNSIDSVDNMKVKYGPCTWFFFGKNYTSTETAHSKKPLLGRPEHTDSVSHDGTWHYQLSGTKIWRIRPTDELLDRINRSSDGDSKKRKLNDGQGKGDDTIELECKQGDILLLNTRLWWHSTVIPMQDSPSISYARDVYFESDAADEPNQQSMTNIDGTYAAQDIEAETILFTEHSMPDCELHRSKTNPNCQVVELEDESGESYMAVVSLRYIKAGEFFCIMESDSEEEEDDSEEESDEEDVCKPCPT